MGVLHELCLGTSPRRAIALLSAAVRVVAASEFHPLRIIPVGMARAQHHQAHVGSHSAWLSSVEAAAGTGCRTDCWRVVCSASRTNRICGMGYRSRPLDVRRDSGHPAPLSHVSAGFVPTKPAPRREIQTKVSPVAPR